MKNILGIIILCLALYGCASGKPYTSSSGSNTKDVNLGFYLGGPDKTIVTQQANLHCQSVSSNLSATNVRQVYKTKGLSDWTDEWDRWKFDCADSSQVAQNNQKQATANTADKITQSKQICRDLGFKVNSEKFADCALKMMSIQFEATNKVASSSGGTTQEIIVKHKQDYDVFDAMLDMSNALLSNNSSSSSSSSSSGSTGTRCVIGKTHAWGHTVMNCN